MKLKPILSNQFFVGTFHNLLRIVGMLEVAVEEEADDDDEEIDASMFVPHLVCWGFKYRK